MDMTRPSSGHDQPQDPINIHHPEEEEHHESRASKMFGKVKARAKKFKNSLTKHGNEPDHDVVDDDEEEDDDENDEPEPAKHVAPVNEVSHVRSDRTSLPESLSHPRETNVPMLEEIIPSETKDSTAVYSSNDNRSVEPEPSRANATYEAPSYPVRTADATYEPEAPSYPIKTADVSEREDSRETHHEPLNTPVSLLSGETEDVKTLGGGEDESLGGQREVNTERPTRLEDGLSNESIYQSESGIGKDSTVRFGGESETEQGKDLAARSFEFDDEKKESGVYNDSPTGFGGKAETASMETFPPKSRDFDQEVESGIGNDSPTRFGGKQEAEPLETFAEKGGDFDQELESGFANYSSPGFGGKTETEPREDVPAKSYDFDQKIESGFANDSPTRFGGKQEAEPLETFPAKGRDFDEKIESELVNDSSTGLGGKTEEVGPRDPMKSYDFEQKMESGVENESPTRFGGKQETERREDFPGKGHEFEQTIGSEIGKDNGGEEAGTERREDFLGKSYEFDQEMESAVGKDSSPTRLDGESEQKESVPARSDDVKMETGSGRDIPEGFKLFNEQFSPEFAGAKAETQEPKPTTYTEMIGSATSFVTGKAMATKNVMASSLGYSGETAGVKKESPVSVGTVDEKLSADEESVKGTALPVTTKLPLSGGGSEAEEMEQEEGKGVPSRDYMVEKMTPEEEDKAFSDMVAAKLDLGGGEGEKKTTTAKDVEVAMEKIPSDKPSEEVEHGEAVVEEGKGGGGMVGKIKGAYNYWVGGTATEEVKPKSPVSVKESSQSLGSTVGTKGFSDSGESGLGETGGSTGAVPVQKGL